MVILFFLSFFAVAQSHDKPNHFFLKFSYELWEDAQLKKAALRYGLKLRGVNTHEELVALLIKVKVPH